MSSTTDINNKADKNGASDQSGSSSSSTSTPTASTTPQTSSGSTFNDENFIKKLDRVQPTTESIQSLALWIMHHKNNHEIICRLWFKRLSEDSLNGKQRLALFYLANDVIQNCKRKNAKIFQDTFKKHMIDAAALVRNDDMKSKIERIFDVWLERSVYDKPFINKLKQSLTSDADLKKGTASPILSSKSAKASSVSINAPSSPPPPPPATQSAKPNKLATQTSHSSSSGETGELSKQELEQIIAEFQPKKLCEAISSFQTLQKETSLFKASMEASRLTDMSLDHIKQYRDKSQCSKFQSEFESYCAKLEEYVQKLNHLKKERKSLVQLMEQSEIFYDAQFKDAKMVFNAYRIYGAKVQTVKTKLDELLKSKFGSNSSTNNNVKLDDLDMEISDDDSTSNSTNNNHHHHPKSSFLLNLISNPYPTASSSASSSTSSSNNFTNGGNINRTHLDPRQNRHNSSSKKSSSPPSSRRKSPDYTRSSSRDAKKRDRSPTPVRDEAGAQAASKNQTNPLDFLTKFINKSSVNAPAPTPTQAQPSNLSYLVSSLQKFVNTSSNNNSASSNNPNPPPPPYAPSQFGYDPSAGINYQNSFMQSDAASQQPQRAVTPTKDELYQQPMIPPSFILPPPPPPPLGYPQLYPPPPPPNQAAPTMPPLLIDPSNPAGFHPNYMYPNQMHVNYHPHFQQGKMPLMSPPSLMGAQIAPLMSSQSSNQAQPQSPGLASPNMAKPNNYWQQDISENGANPNNDGGMRRSNSNEAQFRFNSPAGNKSNDNQGYYNKRKFNYQEEEGFYNNAQNKFGNNKGHDKSSNYNRIPTINSNRNDNISGAGGSSSGGGGGAGGSNRNQSNGSNRYY